MALRTWHPDVAFSGNKVAGEEMDFIYYTVNNPSIDATAVATAVGTPTSSYALAENVMGACDVPRNLRVALGVTSGSTNGMTGTVNGLDQFGEPVIETFSITGAANGGTAIGTKVFSKFVSGTVTFSGAGNAANGCTANIGFGTAGTTTLFGIPGKVGGTKDLLNFNWASAHAVQLIHTNALGSYVIANPQAGIYAIKARTDFGTATGFTVRIKSSYLE